MVCPAGGSPPLDLLHAGISNNFFYQCEVMLPENKLVLSSAPVVSALERAKDYRDAQNSDIV